VQISIDNINSMISFLCHRVALLHLSPIEKKRKKKSATKKKKKKNGLNCFSEREKKMASTVSNDDNVSLSGNKTSVDRSLREKKWEEVQVKVCFYQRKKKKNLKKYNKNTLFTLSQSTNKKIFKTYVSCRHLRRG
jgi:hypothetical protein